MQKSLFVKNKLYTKTPKMWIKKKLQISILPSACNIGGNKKSVIAIYYQKAQRKHIEL